MVRREIQKLVLVDQAIQDLERFRDFHSHDSQGRSYAARKIKEVLDELHLLLSNPQLGKPSLKSGLRQLSIPPFAVFYREEKTLIKILSIWDMRQNPGDHPLGKVYEPHADYVLLTSAPSPFAVQN